MKCPTDIEWLPGAGDAPTSEVLAFPGTKVRICLDDCDLVTLVPRSFPLVLQVEVAGVSRTIRIEAGGG